MLHRFRSNNFLLLLVLSAIWGSAFIAIKISLINFNPISVASLRLIVASFFLLTFLFISNNKYSFRKNEIYFLISVGIIGNFIPFFLISWAEQYIQSNIAGLLMSIGPIMTLILAHFFTKDDKFTFAKFISVLIGLVGTLFIIDFSTLIKIDDDNFIKLVSKILVILAAFGYMISNIIAYNKLQRLNTLVITTFATLYGAIFSIPFFIYSEFSNPSSLDFNSISAIIYLGLFPTAIAFQFRYYITKQSGPIFLSYVAYLIPAFAVLWGFIILNEKIHSSALTGIILVLVGVYIGQKKSMNKIT